MFGWIKKLFNKEVEEFKEEPTPGFNPLSPELPSLADQLEPKVPLKQSKDASKSIIDDSPSAPFFTPAPAAKVKRTPKVKSSPKVIKNKGLPPLK
jgi:hypothetical protein